MSGENCEERGAGRGVGGKRDPMRGMRIVKEEQGPRD